MNPVFALLPVTKCQLLYKHCGRAKDDGGAQTTNSSDLSIRKENKQILTAGQERRTRGQGSSTCQGWSGHATVHVPSKAAHESNVLGHPFAAALLNRAQKSLHLPSGQPGMTSSEEPNYKRI